ncbi:hypothetical protein [Streptomyces sp. NBC_01190]|uniref:hypothetical protein n=1 Tax=Streptomyces sp. NBC_01190 TaxID=2903767 RepID=UPI00386E42FC|nr:hypothetical protein OG519_00120 [Streptomyces sp. NBC_01190]
MKRSGLRKPVRRLALIAGALVCAVGLAVPASADAAPPVAPAASARPMVHPGYPCTQQSTTAASFINWTFYTGQSVCVNGYDYVIQADGNVVVYDATDKALWSTRTAIGRPTRVIMQNDGNFVVYDGTTVLFATGTDGLSSAYICFQPDGKMAIYTANTGRTTCTGKVRWSSKN